MRKAGLISLGEASTLKACLATGDPSKWVLVKRALEDVRSDDEKVFVASFAHAASSLYNSIFAECSLTQAKLMSRGEREKRNLLGKRSLIYGEVGFRSFLCILRRCRPFKEGIFYDLGSGSGRAVFTAVLSTSFQRVVGVELLDSLFEASMDVLDRYDRKLRRLIQGRNDSPQIEYVHGSFTNVDWSDGDLIFANSTCFSDELLMSIGQQSVDLKPGSILVTFTRGLGEFDHLDLFSRFKMEMSWGEATIFIHRRKAHEYEDEPMPRSLHHLTVLH